MMIRIVASLLVLNLGGCTSERGPRAALDAGPPVGGDGGAVDAPGTDTGVPVDAPGTDTAISVDAPSDAGDTCARAACLDDDGCCPSGCDALSDTDCLASVTTFGTIMLGAYTHPTSAVSTASASFVGRASGTTSCTTTTAGDCTLYLCPIGGPAPTFRYESAGRVTISGGAGTPIVLTPNPDRTYAGARFMGATPRWSAGNAITVTAAGATVAAFTLRGTFPGELIALTPTPTMTPTGRRISVTRSAGLGFTWTGERTGEAVAGLTQVTGSTSRAVGCRFPAAARSGTMPASLLSGFSPTAADGTPSTYVSLSHSGAIVRALVGTTLVTLYMNGSVGMSALVDLR